MGVWRGGIEIVALFGEGAVVGERRNLQLADLVADAIDDAGNGAILADLDILVVRRNGDGAAVALQRIAFAGHDLAVGVKGEVTVAGIAHAIGRLHREKAFAVDGQVERRAGGFNAALADIAGDTGILDEADRLLAGLAFGGRDMGDVFFEFGGFALEAGRRDVGEIVRDHVHRTIGRQLLRKTNEK